MAISVLLVSTVIFAAILSFGLALLIPRPHMNLHRQVHIPRKSPRKYLTIRISNIPRDVTRDQFRGILRSLSKTTSDFTSNNILAWSFTPAAIAGLSERFCVATVTFHVAPALSDLEVSLKRKLGEGATRLLVDEDFFGLTPLAAPLQNPAVDIIAVTGLSGHGFGSWKARGRPDMWLRDFLPPSVPNARIMIYGYDTKLPGIKTSRSGDSKHRPLLFIGHSLGGLVLKQALVQACDGSDDDKAIFMSCFALMLFGVPNRGLETSSLMAMVKGQPNEALIRDLSESSRFLSLLQSMFYERFTIDSSRIICVYETQMTPTVEWSVKTASWERTGQKVMMVPHTSATHVSKNEKAYDHLPIDADHSDIVKFHDPSNQDYAIIEARIRQLTDQALPIVKSRFLSHQKKLSALESQYINTLNSPTYDWFRHGKVDDPAPGTLRWFLREKQFLSWKDSNESSILWIRGSAGQGKTVLAKFLLDHLERATSDSGSRPTVIYFFFYDQDQNLRTVDAALRSLIKQLILHRRGLAFQAISEKFDIESPVIPEYILWRVLEELLRAPIFGTIYCVFDALDECRDDSPTPRLPDFFSKLVKSSCMSKQTDLVIKALMISRPKVELSRVLEQRPFIHLKANPQDLEAFIRSQIDKIGLSDDLHGNAIKLLTSRAGQTFIWISIVLKKIKAVTSPLSEVDMEKIITQSPSDLTALYEDIMTQVMRSENLIQQKLLAWVVYGQQALTLPELQEALSVQSDSSSAESAKKHMIRLTEYVVTSVAILEISLGRVYLIHQSAKDFLLVSGHLAAAEFCRILRPSAYLGRICMVYLCFSEFKSGPCRDRAELDQRIRQYPFLRYAARNWHRHIQAEDDISGFASIIRQVTEPKSPTLQTWGEVAGILDLDKAETVWDIATRAHIPWLPELSEFRARGTIVDQSRVKLAAHSGLAGSDALSALVRRGNVQFTNEAGQAIARYFDQGMMQSFLESSRRVIVTPSLMRAAAANERYGASVIRLLLKSLDEFVITDDFVMMLEKNHNCRHDIMEFLLHENVKISNDALANLVRIFGAKIIKFVQSSQWDDTLITEAVVIAAADCKDGEEAMTLLLEQREKDIEITEEVLRTVAASRESQSSAVMRLLMKRVNKAEITEKIIIAAAHNWKTGMEKLSLLLEERKENIQITDDIFRAAVGNYSDSKAMTLLLLESNDNEIEVTEDMIIDSASGSDTSRAVMALLFEKSDNKLQITDGVLEAVVRYTGNGGALIAWLFEKHGDKVHLTEPVTMAVASSWDADVAMELLFEYRESEIKFTENLIKSVAKSYRGSTKAMAELLDTHGNEIEITEDILEAVAENDGSGLATMRLLLDRRPKEVKITEKVMEAAAGNRVSSELVPLLLKERGDEIQITENIAKAAAANAYGRSAMALLLEKRGSEFQITEEVIKAAARNMHSDVLTLLLEKYGSRIKITEEVIKAAAGGYCKEAVGLVLEKCDNEVKITEDIIKAAVAGSDDCTLVMAVLFEKYGSKIEITEDVIINAARNDCNAAPILTLLLRKNNAKITERITKAVAKNSTCGRAMMIWLLDKYGSEIEITEGVVKAAAENRENSRAVLALLFEKCRGEIKVTEKIIKAAARNSRAALLFLLEKFGNEIQITENIVKAAAKNAGSGRAVMLLLFQTFGEMIRISEDVVLAAVRCRGGSRSVMQLLFKERGTDIKITERIMIAAVKSTRGIAALLLEERGHEIEITEDILIAAAGNVEHGEELMDLLLDKRLSDVSALIRDSVCLAAAASGQHNVLKLLCNRHGFLPLRKEWTDIAALFNAAKDGDVAAVKRLLKEGVEPDVKNADIALVTPLWAAACYGHTAIVELLTQRKDVNVNVLSDAGESPIYRPAAQGEEAIVKLLLAAGAKVDFVDEDGKTPASVARKNGHGRIADMLERVSSERSEFGSVDTI
ncbi:putative ankyrin repeat protein [Trichoderma atroviride IMI 206040]|uniref:Ankyrin repeat protein n=1 Tax=Hypocrea atroviridis (strain ATCC 20476 / IMI 206040) TaxID=452589 RepID=G9NF10_HYPAI|nr:putative ankyrin repeat protein [Trichoderma atroviride IMI 206040]EHK50529.1 putative ankyrin repeat protein [Trichoderma atroviride IMI 206040]